MKKLYGESNPGMSEKNVIWLSGVTMDNSGVMMKALAMRVKKNITPKPRKKNRPKSLDPVAPEKRWWLERGVAGFAIKSAREAKSLSQNALAELLLPWTSGKTVRTMQAQISSWETGRRSGEHYFPVLQHLLEVSLREDGKLDQYDTIRHNNVDSRAMAHAMSRVLYNSSAGAGGEIMYLDFATPEEHHVPPELTAVPTAYAVRVSSSVMEPSFRPADLIWLNPDVAVKPGDDVLLIPTDEQNPSRCLRELIADNSLEWIVRQYNPDQIKTMKKTEWPTCHRVHHRTRPQKT